MALLSDIDWGILLSVAAFFVLGKEGSGVIRQVGRVYGRLSAMKSELLGEIARAADIPAPVPGRPTSIRSSLLSWDPNAGRTSGIPAAVSVPPTAVAAPAPTPIPVYSTLGLGPSVWAGSQPAEPARWEVPP